VGQGLDPIDTLLSDTFDRGLRRRI
jgi:hypothetical protein